MSSRTVVRALCLGLIFALVVVINVSHVSPAVAGNYRVGAVGGVVIQVDGVVRDAARVQRQTLAKLRRGDFKQPAREMNQSVGMRMISLRTLESACQKVLADPNAELPADIKYLGGMQRVQYVFVSPEKNDIVIAGPAEGWKIDDEGNVVGVTTGRPVVKLDDLLVALRTVHNARHGGIGCSINPTEQGIRALNDVLDQQRRLNTTPNFPVLEQNMKTAFGPQQISLTGVSETSHLARVLVAADYRMKRLAMNLDSSPIAGFPSYVQMLKNAKQTATSVTPRWWLACNYQPVAKTDDSLSWELRGQGVKCLTEDDVIGEDGKVTQSGRTSPIAQKWADLMTEKYEELSGKVVIFGELRNVMDLCVVAAVIDEHELCAKAGCDLPFLTGSDSQLAPEYWHPPKSVPPQCSFLRTRGGWVVTASGGVQIESIQVAAKTETVAAIGNVREQAQGSGKTWWWN